MGDGGAVLDGDLADRWRWIMDIIFGGLLVFGLQTFVVNFPSIAHLPMHTVFVSLYAAVGVTAFFVYDVTVHHILTSSAHYPFQDTGLSALRFCLDVAMAFILALILLPGLGGLPWQATVRVLVAAWAWHLGALAWHALAHHEQPGKRPDPFWTLGFHGAVSIAYWETVWLVALYVRSGHESILHAFNRSACLTALSTLLLLVAVWRVSEMLAAFKSGPSPVYRNRSQKVMILLVSFLAPLTISLPALTSRTLSPRWKEALLVFGLTLMALGVRAAFCAIQLRPQGVRVVKVLSVTPLPWNEIVEFRMDRARRRGPTYRVEMVNGDDIGLRSMSPRRRKSVEPDRMDRVIKELNDRVRQEAEARGATRIDPSGEVVT